jgi:chitinase
MISKASMPSSKVVVSVTSYGRSFEMTTAGCYTETCTFTGPLSRATPGKCTGTAGYIAQSEFFPIIAASGNILSFLDGSYSNILVYDDN